MKRVSALMCIVLLAITSCSQDELRETVPMDQIGFRTPSMTKASELLADDLEECGFYVSALLESENADESKSYSPYINNEHFTWSLESYISQTAHYWPSDGSYLQFYAFTPASTEFSVEKPEYEDGKVMILEGFKPAEEISEQDDFVVAEIRTNKNEASDDIERGGIYLEFNHALSQIEINAKNTHSRYQVQVMGVRLGNIPTGASYRFGDNQNRWAFAQTPETADYTGTRESAITLPNYPISIMKASGDNAMVIPQQLTAWDPTNPTSTGAYIGVLVNIKVKATENGDFTAQAYPAVKDAFDWVAIPIDTKWEAGKRYSYTLDFSEGAGYVAPDLTDNTNNTPGTRIGNDIEFNVTIDDWTEETIIKRNNAQITGIWKAYRFVEKRYNNDHTVVIGETDWDLTNPGNYTEETIIENLKNRTQNFYYLKIPETGENIICLNDDGTEKDAQATFSYIEERGVFDIPTLQTDAQLIEVSDTHATIFLNYFNEGWHFQQWVYYTIEKLN